MTLFVKKVVCSVLVLGLVFLNVGVTETRAGERYGVISFYDGEGKKGSDGKILTKYDVAVSYVDRFLPKGTIILTTNETKNIKKTLYKWDYGSFGANVILDVQRSMFIEMGGIISDGYFKGFIMY